MLRAVLAVEDGTLLTGKGFGYPCETSGEVVFNTGMTGYTESLTDPSYCGQILIQTYPMIGNYGIPAYSIVDKFGVPLHFESDRIQVRGYVVHSLTQGPSHWSKTKTLNEWLYKQRIPGIEDVDTRELAKKIRVRGTVLGVLKVAEEIDIGHIETKLKEMVDPDEGDLVKDVTTLTPIAYRSGESPNVALIDCGAKFGIIRNLLHRGIDVTRVPYSCSFDEIISLNPS